MAFSAAIHFSHAERLLVCMSDNRNSVDPRERSRRPPLLSSRRLVPRSPPVRRCRDIYRSGQQGSLDIGECSPRCSQRSSFDLAEEGVCVCVKEGGCVAGRGGCGWERERDKKQSTLNKMQDARSCSSKSNGGAVGAAGNRLFAVCSIDIYTLK